ncbi:hypothetical protein [Kitasatospora sp. McL0602]|uniref:hypothetical protein n=1 Tax=Kitasatospora sp. McL0602 TaxID=3439530 RepID=UPI003F8B7EEC
MTTMHSTPDVDPGELARRATAHLVTNGIQLTATADDAPGLTPIRINAMVVRHARRATRVDVIPQDHGQVTVRVWERPGDAMPWRVTFTPCMRAAWAAEQGPAGEWPEDARETTAYALGQSHAERSGGWPRWTYRQVTAHLGLQPDTEPADMAILAYRWGWNDQEDHGA